MRVHVVRTIAIAAVLGAVAGAVVALVGQWWASHQEVTEFGYYSYTPVPSAANLSPVHRSLAPTWWQLLWPAMLVGAAVAVLATVALRVRRDRLRPLPHAWRGLTALSATGVVLGAAVGGVLYLRAEPADEVTYHGRYVDYLPSPDAYSSSLSITFDAQPSQVVTLLGICAGTGLAGGLVAGGGLAVSRRRQR